MKKAAPITEKAKIGLAITIIPDIPRAKLKNKRAKRKETSGVLGSNLCFTKPKLPTPSVEYKKIANPITPVPISISKYILWQLENSFISK